MKLLNIMLGRGRGGLEQAAFDYHEALKRAGCEVHSLLQRSALMRSTFDEAGFSYDTLAPLGEWDWLAASKLHRIAAGLQAEAVIAHGNRAISLALKGCKGNIPVIGVAHNYQIKKRFPQCDGIFCITRDLIEECVHLDIPRSRCFHVPNLIRIGALKARSGFHSPVVIGTLGRFVPKKGIDILLQSIAALRQQGHNVRAIIGGDGVLASTLTQQAVQLGISEYVTFTGWVSDKAAFFDALDIFVLPSHHEPFGIVLIEAMAAGLPCITTDTEGPCEIITQHHDAIMIEKAKPYLMAQTLADLIIHPDQALAMGRAAHETAKNRYDIAVVSEGLHQALLKLI